MNDIFKDFEEVQNAVDSGEVKGYTQWSQLEGACDLLDIDVVDKSGVGYISFKLKHEKDGAREFLIKLPTPSDSDSAKFMGTQRVYKTLYAVAGVTPGDGKIAKVFSDLKKECVDLKIPCTYTLRVFESISQKTGTTYTNQSLETLTPVFDLEG